MIKPRVWNGEPVKASPLHKEFKELARADWRGQPTRQVVGMFHFDDQSSAPVENYTHVDGVPIWTPQDDGITIERRFGTSALAPGHQISEGLLGNHQLQAQALLQRQAAYQGLADCIDNAHAYRGSDIKPSWQTSYEKEHARANKLADEAGSLRTERDDLLRENAVLRRKLERAGQTGSKP
jgi:hypothetical protein